MAINFEAEEKHFVWDDFQEGLVVLGGTEQKNERIKRQRRKSSVVDKSKIYCPHAYLILNFLEILNDSQKIKYRKYYLRKVAANEPDVIILQDIKNLVMYLLRTPVSLQFINFFHLRVVDRLLRALILYFQFFTEIWEEIVKKRAAITKKAPNPLAEDSRLKRAEELRVLRCLVAREYCELLLGCEESEKFQQILSGATDAIPIESQSEKDLRIFEPLIAIAHRVIWIALQRKYFNIIEVELHRLFRTDAYNTADRRTGRVINKGMLEEELRILYGPKMPPRRKLLKNSPLARQLVNEFCDFRILSLGLINFESEDPRINYLKNALVADEEKLLKSDVKVGILGQSRVKYDIMLILIEDEKAAIRETAEAWERKRSSLFEKTRRSITTEQEPTIMPAYGPNLEFLEVFPLNKVEQQCGKYDESREEARKKWISRELSRQSYTYSDAISIATTTNN